MEQTRTLEKLNRLRAKRQASAASRISTLLDSFGKDGLPLRPPLKAPYMVSEPATGRREVVYAGSDIIARSLAWQYFGMQDTTAELWSPREGK